MDASISVGFQVKTVCDWSPLLQGRLPRSWGGDALMAIGLDAIWIGVEHQGAELTAGATLGGTTLLLWHPS